jgi:hypothetical protein
VVSILSSKKKLSNSLILNCTPISHFPQPLQARTYLRSAPKQKRQREQPKEEKDDEEDGKKEEEEEEEEEYLKALGNDVVVIRDVTTTVATAVDTRACMLHYSSTRFA